MHLVGRNYSFVLAFMFCMSATLCAQSTPQEGFFENRIRPLLIEHCYSCHSQEAIAKNELKGGLLLDSSDAIRQGGDSGSAIDLTDVDASLILSAVRYEGLEMPPDGKLSDQNIADIRKWIEDGAFHSGKASAPAGEGKHKTGIDIEAAKQQWPYLPLQRPTTPNIASFREADEGPHSLASANSPLDHYLLARAEDKSLEPTADMDRARLARRLYFDLIGLPPSPEQLEQFLNDESPDAYERLVDRLLASPQFGVRWGRNWLDIVRYAESTTLRGLIYTEAWRYRDYVIESIQQDRPLSDMIREHVAGDLLPHESLDDQTRGIIATTFLTLGNHNLEEQDKQQLRMDVVDEQIDVIGQAFLGQTLGCARCHDHKFDPIPTKDYYAMAGILRNVQTLKDANVSNWVTRPLPIPAEQQAHYEQLQNELSQAEEQIKSAKKELANFTAEVPNEPIPLKRLQGVIVDDSEAQVVGAWTHSQHVKPYLGDGYLHDENSGKGEKTLTFATNKLINGTYEVRLAYSPGESRAKKIEVTVASADGEKVVYVNQSLKPELSPCFVSLGNYRFETGGQAYVLISTGNSEGHVTADAVQFLPQGQTESLINVAESIGVTASERDAARRELQKKLTETENQKKRLQAELDKRPQAMSIIERPEIEEPYINIRGVVHSRGAEIKRGFLSVAGGNYGLELPAKESGRLQLADWLMAAKNPLTSRVLANRIWTWTMGMGLARNPDHLGPSSEPPLHPELIDYLACDLIEHEWSLKKLVRTLVLSAAYRRTTFSITTDSTDPENRYWMRGQKKTLTAESLRDSMLQIAGELDLRMFGTELEPMPTADYGFEAKSQRRSAFLPMLRNSLPKLLVAFDMADPSRVTGARSQSIVAPQALLMLNSDEVTRCAQNAAKRLLQLPLDHANGRLDYAFRQTLMRLPTDAERSLFMDYLGRGENSVDTWQDIYQTLFGSAEFRSLE
jgi:hypothetical protein